MLKKSERCWRSEVWPFAGVSVARLVMKYTIKVEIKNCFATPLHERPTNIGGALHEADR
ncbi:hypothetical protein MCEMSEM22_02322 [Comamonadaceae bacterium]